MKNKKAFTLVEVIVVLVIIALLAAVLIPSLIHYINKAKENTAISECRSAKIAAQTILSENYAKGNIIDETTISSYFDKIIVLAEVDGSIVFIETNDLLITKLQYLTTGNILVTFEDNKYTIDKSELSDSADGYLKASMTLANDESVQNVVGYDKKTKALRTLYLEKYNGTAPKLSSNELKLYKKTNTSKDLTTYKWVPVFSSSGEVILVGTTDDQNKSNIMGSMIFYNNTYYYFYQNKYSPIGSKYVGDKDFDMSLLYNATATPDENPQGNTWYII